MNVALARKAVQQIERHPEGWTQRSWRCGTGACLAYHVVAAAGGRWALPDNPNDLQVVLPDGRNVFVARAARELLDLDYDDEGEAVADNLFAAFNLLSDIKASIGRGGRPGPVRTPGT